MTPPAREGLSDETVLDHALGTFAERGFLGASVREVARELRVSHNFIPQRWGSKERLWYVAVDHGFGWFADKLVVVAAEHVGEDELVQLRAVMVCFVETSAVRPAVLRVITQEALQPGPRLDHLHERFIGPAVSWAGRRLDRLAASGRVTSADVTLLYFLLVHGIGGVVALPALASRFGEGIDVTDALAVRAAAERTVDLLFDGLLARTAS